MHSSKDRTDNPLVDYLVNDLAIMADDLMDLFCNALMAFLIHADYGYGIRNKKGIKTLGLV